MRPRRGDGRRFSRPRPQRWPLGLLRASGYRPRWDAHKPPDELPASHSITSLAMANSVSGRVRPRALALLKSTINPTFPDEVAHLTSALRHFPAHAPSSRFKCEWTILAISKQSLAHTRFELFAVTLGKRHNVGSPGARTIRKWLPVVFE
jgi:hypothetical protein